MTGNVPDLDAESFESFVDNGGVAVIDFWAPWCGPCKRLEPAIKELAGELEGQVRFGKINTDDEPSVAQRFGVMSIPTMVVFKDGDQVDQIVGAIPKPELKRKVEAHV